MPLLEQFAHLRRKLSLSLSITTLFSPSPSSSTHRRFGHSNALFAFQLLLRQFGLCLAKVAFFLLPWSQPPPWSPHCLLGLPIASLASHLPTWPPKCLLGIPIASLASLLPPWSPHLLVGLPSIKCASPSLIQTPFGLPRHFLGLPAVSLASFCKREHGEGQRGEVKDPMSIK